VIGEMAPRPRLLTLVAGAAAILCALVFALLSPTFARAQSEPVSEPPATCFWEGPISTERPTTRGFDGRNFNFPEESATYWLARFRLPPGSKLLLRGQYPYGRYMSINSYTDGEPVDALSDIDIAPDPGSVNPFIAGARRDLPNRSWTVTVVADPPPETGAREPNTIYGNQSGDRPIELLYRVYEPDPGRDLTGGTGLPAQELVRADGTTASGDAACAEVNDPNREIPVDTIPADLWRTGRSTPPCDAETNPAYDPPRWERFFNIEYAALAVVSDCTDEGREARLSTQPEVRGGFYSNRDSAYIYSHLAGEFGPVLVLRGMLPRFPRTYEQPAKMPSGDVRFWSLCTGESRVTTRTPDCLSDRQVLEQSGRSYTIVVSKQADRPANATAACGVAWVDWGERGDAAGDTGYGFLIMRNMLASPSFRQAIQRVERPGTEAQVMGPYFPRSSYATREDFEARGCPVD
jgi:hypothetical protein